VHIHLFVNRNPRLPQAFLPLMFTEALAKRTDVFSGIAWVNGAAQARTVPAPGENPLLLTAMTANALDVLEVRVALGRAFSGSDAENPLVRSVLLTREAWVRRFYSSPEVLRRSWSDGRVSYRIIGVLPRGFLLPSSRLMEQIDGIYALPARYPSGRGALATAPFARLQPGVSIQRAADVANALSRVQWEAGEDAAVNSRPLVIQPLQSGLSILVRPQLYVLFGAGLVILVLASANLTLLLFAWNLSRERSLGIRLALGASSRILLRSVVLESVAVCLAGGILAWLLYLVVHDALLTAVPATLRTFAVAASDGRLMAATLLTATFSAVAVAVVPARAVTRLDVLTVIESRRLSRGDRLRTFQALVGVQVLLAIVLVTAAGHTVPTFARMLWQSPGFDPDDLFVVQVNHDWSSELSPAHSPLRVSNVLEAVSEIDGVVSSAAAASSPLELQSGESREFWKARGQTGDVRAVSHSFFETLRVPVVTGRAFSAADIAGQTMVAVVNRSGAGALWPDTRLADLTGQEVRTQDGLRTVIGVVEDFRAYPGAALTPTLFLPITATEVVRSQTALPVLVRMRPGGIPDRGFFKAILDRRFPANAVTVQSVTMTMLPWLEQPRLLAILFGSFGAVGLLLVGTALLAVTRFEILRRHDELCLRSALGASPSRLRATAINFILWPLAGGTALGLATSIWLGVVWSAYDETMQIRGGMSVVAAGLVTSAVLLVAWVATRPVTRATDIGRTLASTAGRV
jgi:predicted permease